MFKKQLKYLKMILLTLLICTPSLVSSANAEEPSTHTMTGTINITLSDTEDNVSKECVELGIVQIAEINKGLYELKEPFSSSEIDLNKIETTDELNKAANCFVELVTEADYIVKTNADGTTFYKGLPVGVYLIYPIELASYDHITPVIVAIPTFDEEVGQMSYFIDVNPKHYPVLSNIQIKKVDSNDKSKVLKNAEFTLYDSDHNEIISLATDKDGICTFEGYRRGTYYLRETKAPQGYRLSDEYLKVVIDENYDEDNIYTVQVSNELLPLISTGDHNQVILFAVVSCLAIICGVSAYLLKKRKHEIN